MLFCLPEILFLVQKALGETPGLVPLSTQTYISSTSTPKGAGMISLSLNNSTEQTLNYLLESEKRDEGYETELLRSHFLTP